MLLSPPPGYAPAAINRQMPQPLARPGTQGLEAQGYTPAAPPGTMLTSSYSPPSSAPMPDFNGGPMGGSPLPPIGGEQQIFSGDDMKRPQAPPPSFMNAVGAQPPGAFPRQPMPQQGMGMPQQGMPMPPGRIGGNPLGPQNMGALLSILSRGGGQPR